jgi:LemA protein
MKNYFLALLAAVSLSGCGYNDFQRLDEQAKSAWSEVLNQYQRRADLVPNIVATVKGEANFEQETLTKVVEARAKATSMQVSPETLNNPEAFKKFQSAQGELSGALSRLLVVSEQYPNLKANQGFSDLRVQLEGTENRITVARNRYIQAIQEYNVLARSFPSNLTAMVFSYQPLACRPPSTSSRNNRHARAAGYGAVVPPLGVHRRCAGRCGWRLGARRFGGASTHCPCDGQHRYLRCDCQTSFGEQARHL